MPATGFSTHSSSPGVEGGRCSGLLVRVALRLLELRWLLLRDWCLFLRSRDRSRSRSLSSSSYRRERERCLRCSRSRSLFLSLSRSRSFFSLRVFLRSLRSRRRRSSSESPESVSEADSSRGRLRDFVFLWRLESRVGELHENCLIYHSHSGRNVCTYSIRVGSFGDGGQSMIVLTSLCCLRLYALVSVSALACAKR